MASRMDQNELLYKIAITQIPKVGAVLAKNLVGFSGGVEAVFKQSRSSLMKIPGVGEKIATHILEKRTFSTAEVELEFIEKNKIQTLFYLDKDYPIRLKRIRDAPVLLYYKGTASLNAGKVLSVVGTRKPTPYGISQCQKLIESLRSLDILIVSGLAYGVDVTAHRSSIEMQLSTVGVLGSGLDRMYPASHRKVARNMIVSGGGLLTEFIHGTKPDKENFPMRNRIIAGMCDAVLVVESDLKGGSMITAEMANGYHKDVFAFPGRIGDQMSRGTNHLIKTDRAHLLESGEELCRFMQWQPTSAKTNIQPQLFQSLTSDEQLTYEVLRANEQTSIDKIYKEVSLSVSQIAAILLSLEFKGMIRSLPGKMYMVV